jgi:hypothetical protein
MTRYIPIYIQQDATLHSLFNLKTVLHVSGGTSTHHQERIQLYLQPLVVLAPEFYISFKEITSLMQKIFQFIILTFVYGSICFGRFPAHYQELNDCSGSLWFYLCVVVTVVLCSWSARPAGPTTNAARLSPRYEGKTRGCDCSH